MEGALAPFHLPRFLGACQASLGDRHKARVRHSPTDIIQGSGG